MMFYQRAVQYSIVCVATFRSKKFLTSLAAVFFEELILWVYIGSIESVGNGMANWMRDIYGYLGWALVVFRLVVHVIRCVKST